MTTAAEPSNSPASRTRSKTATHPAIIPQSHKWKPIDDDLSVLATQNSSPPNESSKKRKRDSISSSAKDEHEGSSTKQQKTASPKKKNDEEKRLRIFRKYPPHSYLQKLDRATSQRMFVLSRERITFQTVSYPTEIIKMAGTTGNIYQVTISLIPTCTCPDYLKGNQCKHIIYVLHNVLKAPAELEYQLAFLSTELQRIFDAAPMPAATDADAAVASGIEAQDSHAPSNRKEISGDCPICFMEFEPEEGEEIVWCKAACGNNIHKHCFEQWARSSKGKKVKCVYCRTPWQEDDYSIPNVFKRKRGEVKNEEGYYNIASQLGLSGPRDTSSYHPYWVRRQQRMGLWAGSGDMEEEDEDEWSGEE
ncbi:MAG: hypothetical protein Q9220_004027 [cf. Caloplaca sp. 1 TL-2023]